jgi:hypothetical protein
MEGETNWERQGRKGKRRESKKGEAAGHEE